MNYKFRDLRAEEIEVRVQSIKTKKAQDGTYSVSGAVLLFYKDARCDMNILDETVGPENWQRDHYQSKDSLFCKVGIYDENKGWVWKADCGTESNTEAQKGESSDSFKRACVCWGIGRELYTAPFTWVGPEGIRTYDTKRTDKYGAPVFATNDHFSVEEVKIENKTIVGVKVRNDSLKRVVFEFGFKEPPQFTPLEQRR